MKLDNIVIKVNRNRIRWAGNVQRMMEYGTVKKILSEDPGERRKRG